MEQFPRSLFEFQRQFSSEEACAAWLFAARWPAGFVCPGCGGGRAWTLQTKADTFECASCGRQTSVTAGTVLHASKLPLTVWFLAAFLMATHSNGISARQLQAQLGLGSYRTAWMLAAKLRRAMQAPDRHPLAAIPWPASSRSTRAACRCGPWTIRRPAARGAATTARC